MENNPEFNRSLGCALISARCFAGQLLLKYHSRTSVVQQQVSNVDPSSNTSSLRRRNVPRNNRVAAANPRPIADHVIVDWRK